LLTRIPEGGDGRRIEENTVRWYRPDLELHYRPGEI
jgi:hypothetical protein